MPCSGDRLETLSIHGIYWASGGIEGLALAWYSCASVCMNTEYLPGTWNTDIDLEYLFRPWGLKMFQIKANSVFNIGLVANTVHNTCVMAEPKPRALCIFYLVSQQNLYFFFELLLLVLIIWLVNNSPCIGVNLETSTTVWSHVSDTNRWGDVSVCHHWPIPYPPYTHNGLPLQVR